jgi:hypothetical protein
VQNHINNQVPDVGATYIPNHVGIFRWLRAVHRLPLKDGDIRLLMVLADRAGQNGRCHPTYAQVAKDLKKDVRTVRRRADRLREAGYLNWKSGNQHRANQYSFIMTSDLRDLLTAQAINADTNNDELSEDKPISVGTDHPTRKDKTPHPMTKRNTNSNHGTYGPNDCKTTRTGSRAKPSARRVGTKREMKKLFGEWLDEIDYTGPMMDSLEKTFRLRHPELAEEEFTRLTWEEWEIVTDYYRRGFVRLSAREVLDHHALFLAVSDETGRPYEEIRETWIERPGKLYEHTLWALTEDAAATPETWRERLPGR